MTTEHATLTDRFTEALGEHWTYHSVSDFDGWACSCDMTIASGDLDVGLRAHVAAVLSRVVADWLGEEAMEEAAQAAIHSALNHEHASAALAALRAEAVAGTAVES